MTKTAQVIAAILEQLQQTLQQTQDAANEAHQAATHEQSVPETQYDTLGLEASYLAEGQSRRVAELQEAITRFHQLTEKEFGEDDPITLGAQVIVEDEHGNRRHLFLGPDAGGVEVTLDDELITVVSPAAPLGAELVQKYVGDAVHIGQHLYEIVEIG
ncbi:transcription elongation factor GreAB [Pontibacterium granulatum]|uniref:transcription elongation factor GreAB n=1 Tax=Pontibacterium granulatum TaxID=2036029 RepID=UPI00249CAA9D|nr:transcription elongation factor GreAB [Pontibacterium granulatum]MDI3325034.1 transcription elongation factor GreAB [Pontibacterium granulatum]